MSPGGGVSPKEIFRLFACANSHLFVREKYLREMIFSGAPFWDDFEHVELRFFPPGMAIPNSASGRRHDTRPLTLYRHRSIDLVADTPSAMDALPDILRCDDHEPRDFRDEETVKQFVRPIRWLSVNVGERRLFRLNVRLAPLEMFRTRRVRARISIDSRRGDREASVFVAPTRTPFPAHVAHVNEIPFPRTSRRSGSPPASP